ncbi:MAG: hypothetical protein NWF09_07765 [Candidatus Bathyarchaeota archaeon]|nr:hypothetical protein [Candidatus Bathyarchaeota archaeon]
MESLKNINPKFALELECEKELAKMANWDRTQAMNDEVKIDTTFVATPKNLVIQGILPAPASNGSRSINKCKECREYSWRFNRCGIKQRLGIDMKNYCPIKVKSQHDLSRISYTRYQAGFRLPFAPLNMNCGGCNFLDKINRRCLSKSLNGNCAYATSQSKETQTKVYASFPCKNTRQQNVNLNRKLGAVAEYRQSKKETIMSNNAENKMRERSSVQAPIGQTEEWYCSDCGETWLEKTQPKQCPFCSSKNISLF